MLILLAVSTAIRLAFAGMADLSQDESYAFAVSRTFQWSFFDHPPLAFWVAFLTQTVFGPDLPALLLRLPFVLMFTASTWAMYALTARFYDERAGLWAAALLNASPFFFISAGCWVVPDGPLVLALLCGALFFARALEASGQAAWRDWLIAGLCLGLALLSKYHALVIALGAVAILFMPGYRHWLRRPHPYAAAAFAALLCLPVLWWNALNGWVSFSFQLGRAGGEWGLRPTQALILLAGEAVYLLPWLLVGLVIGAAFSRGSAARFLLPLALPLIVLFNLLPLLGRSGLPHWSMPGWLFLFPALGHLAAVARANARKWPLVLGALSAVTTLAVPVGVVLTLSAWRIVPGNPGFERALAEGANWTGVRQGLAEAGLLDRPGTFYAAMSWADGAQLAVSLRSATLPVVLGQNPRGFAFLADPNAYLGQDAIFVAARGDLAGMEDFAIRHFQSVETIGTFETAKGGQPAFSHTVLLAHGFSVPVNVPYGLGVR